MKLAEFEQEALADTLSSPGWALFIRLVGEHVHAKFVSLFTHARTDKPTNQDVGGYDALALLIQDVYKTSGIEKPDSIVEIFKRN